MVASFDSSVSSLPIPDYESSEDGNELLPKGSNHHDHHDETTSSKLPLRTRPTLGKSLSMSERFGTAGSLLRGGAKKKSYLNPRRMRPAMNAKDKNKGNVLKSLGKFLSTTDGDGDGKDNKELAAGGGGINKFLGSRLGVNKKDNDSADPIMDGFASLDDENIDDEMRMSDEEVELRDHNSTVHTVTTAPPSFSSSFELSVSCHKDENTGAAPLQFVPSMEHSMHNSASSISAFSIDEEDDDDISVSSTEHSCALNDSIDSMGSFGCEESDDHHFATNDDGEALKEENQIRKNKGSSSSHHRRRKDQHAKDHNEKEDTDREPRRERKSSSSSDGRRSRSKTARQRPRERGGGDALSSSTHSQRTRSSSNHSTKSHRSTTMRNRRASSKGAVSSSTRTRPTLSKTSSNKNLDSSSNHSARSGGGPKRSRSLGAVRSSRGGPSRMSSLPSSSSSSRGGPTRKLERSSSGSDLRDKYQQRSNLHRQNQHSRNETSSSSAGPISRPRMTKQKSLPAIKVGTDSRKELSSAFEW